MTSQLDFLQTSDAGVAFRPDVSSERNAIMAQLERNAGTAFMEKAKAFVVRYLGEQIQAPGEEITDACRAAGICPVGSDDRAFGAVYLTLSRSGKIEKAGTCERRKGHNTSGGIIWRLTPQN